MKAKANPHPAPPLSKGRETDTKRFNIGLRRQNPKQTALARTLRRKMTAAERKLWMRLRGNQLCGLSFRRQVPFGKFILDFYCPSLKMAVEVDGGQHFHGVGAASDSKRDAFLRSEGLLVLRFSNVEVLKDLEAVLSQIIGFLSPHG